MADATKKTADNAAKDLPTRRLHRDEPASQFFREVRREASKVTWPTWKETWLTTIDGVHHGRHHDGVFLSASIGCSLWASAG